MNIEKMREEFESAFRKEGGGYYGEATRAAMDVVLERGSDGIYRSILARGAWWAWQASRAAIEIELPKIVDKEWANTHAERSAMRDAIGLCKKRIEAAGIPTK
jgi:hypothetical protein